MKWIISVYQTDIYMRVKSYTSHPFPYNRTLPPDPKFRKRTYDPEDTQ